jgi:small subunit ribosomal protein S1
MSTDYYHHQSDYTYQALDDAPSSNDSQSDASQTPDKHATEEPTESMDEGYWSAILNEGEYSQSNAQGAPSANIDEDDIIAHDDVAFITGEQIQDYNAIAVHWHDIRAIMDNDEILHLKVIGYNRGGLLVEWNELRGFVPASQLIDFPSTNTIYNRHDALTERVGATLALRVIELDPEKNRLILSERAAQVASGTRAEILQRLDPGTIAIGTITNLCDFGAFVDLGGVEGLIHISELSWGRVGHPKDILERGQEVKVYVLDVDPDEARIALSLKRLHADPWATVQERYQIGEMVEGTITNVVDFGAFACIEEGLEGLIHFSELAEGHFLHPRNVVSEGDVVQARILSINGQARRLGLSLRKK